MSSRQELNEVSLVAASCTTGWADWEHGNLWLAPGGLARIPLGWLATYSHTFQGIDPAIGQIVSITQSDLSQALTRSPRSLWMEASYIEVARLHRGITCDRVHLHLKDGASHKLLWIRNKAGTQQLEDALRGWLGDRLIVD
jgi:hypothetical protein